jgi:hypothetical protein
MTLPKHLDDAVAKLEQASHQIDQARANPLTLENIREWLEGLTNYVKATTEIQQLNNESVHEKLHDLAGRIGLRHFPSGHADKD